MRETARESQPWFVYLARCGDGSIYTGIARHVGERLAAHNAGRGAKYTRGRGPVTLAASYRCRSQGEALRLEMAVKRLPRDAKERLTQGRYLSAFARRWRMRLATETKPAV